MQRIRRGQARLEHTCIARDMMNDGLAFILVLVLLRKMDVQSDAEMDRINA